ncbi:hypothetical protein R1flu_011591 [Riccia fluitans]|uniref:Chalcone isomerase domain-containing protein n=1 Tax=Riccia fluitans TaxID=41844 RepID=A0ABD1Z9E5_9MARC
MASISGSFGFGGGSVPHKSQTFTKQLARDWRAVGVGAASAAGLVLALSGSKSGAIHQKNAAADIRDNVMEKLQGFPSHPLWRNSLIASLSLSNVEELVEPKTGVVFPASSPDGQQLTGVGLRKKSILGLKNITVYAYGVYADPDSLRTTLGDKCENLNTEEVKKAPALYDDVIEKDVGLTVRLVIVYGKLKIGSIRSAFEGSIGSGLKKFSGEENRELLESFTGAFTDDLKIPRGTTIDLTRLPGHVLQTKIDGREVGNVQSALLCRALFDLYLGDDAFDKPARETMGSNLTQLLCI